MEASPLIKPQINKDAVRDDSYIMCNIIHTVAVLYSTVVMGLWLLLCIAKNAQNY